MNKLTNKLIKLIDKIINIVVTILLLLFIMFAGYALYDSYYVYNGAKLSSDIKKLGPDESDFDIFNLQEINPDICAWIKIDDTNIDYPVVIGENNDEYLDKDYKKKYATSGSIFLDYRNDRDINDNYSIMYGHNLEANLMFSNIKKFENVDFFNSHSMGKLYTAKGNYQIDILFFERVNGFSSKVYGLDMNKNGKNSELIKYFEENAIRKRKLEFTKENKLLLLSTCDAAGSNNRAVLVCKLTRITDDDEIIDSSLRKIDSQVKDKKKTNKGNDTIAPRQTVRVAGVKISTRTILLIILSIIVIVIFIIALITRYGKKNNKKTNKVSYVPKNNELSKDKKIADNTGKGENKKKRRYKGKRFK